MNTLQDLIEKTVAEFDERLLKAGDKPIPPGLLRQHLQMALRQVAERTVDAVTLAPRTEADNEAMFADTRLSYDALRELEAEKASAWLGTDTTQAVKPTNPGSGAASISIEADE